jgi:hypothetical protein
VQGGRRPGAGAEEEKGIRCISCQTRKMRLSPFPDSVPYRATFCANVPTVLYWNPCPI